jgi:glycosyltransferase involved in cell wall biosynthesis
MQYNEENVGDGEMLRLMFLGDRIVGGISAYSKVGYETCTRLARLGYHVAHIPMGRVNRMGKQSFEGVLIYPSGDDYFSEDVAPNHYVDFKADMIITIKEPWVFNSFFKYAVNFTPMAVIDHSPVSAAITSRLERCFKVIAISRFGQIELRQKNIESTYIPHGVRCDVYKPLPSKAECRKLFFLPQDAYIVGIVAMNRVRKMIPRMLQGYKRYLELNPNVKSVLMLWTDVQPTALSEEVATSGVADVGVNLLPEIVELGLAERVHWPRWEDVKRIGGLPEWDPTGGWDMVKLFNCFDVLLLCSGGEGFGLPLVEAQACGVPVITTNYAAGPEQVGAGLTVPWSDYAILNTPGTRYVLADIDKMAEALTKIFNADREKLAKKAREFAMRYDWSRVIREYWLPFLENCSEELYPLITKDGLKTWA